MSKRIGITAAALAMLSLAACVNNGPVVHPEKGPERGERAVLNTPAPKEDEEFAYTTAPTEAPTEVPIDAVDELGNVISGADHYQRYLTFRFILVYEEDGDTFLDGYIVNDYVKPITCAVDIVYEEDDGEEIARARLQTRDGKYLLVLEPGENVVYARILTDMTLTEREYRMEFDKDIGVDPIG